MTLPTTHTAGDTFTHLATLADYPASAGWVGKLRLVPRSVGGSVVELTATASGSSYAFAATATATASWAAGGYTLVLWVELGAVKYTAESGQFTVAADPRAIAAGTDSRSQARRTLDDLMAARATWAVSQGRTRSYKIGDRERVFATAAELDQEIQFWTAQLASETAAARLAQGLRPKNRLLVRFTRPR